MSESGGKLQPIRQFTAQVRRPDSGQIVGTAFAVSFERGLLVTCKHVIEAVSKPCIVGTAVYVYFPLLGGDPKDKAFPATVERMFDDHDDDVVILKLKQGMLPPGVAVATLGDAEPSTNCVPACSFRSFGFRRLADYQGLPAYGTIIDYTIIPQGKVLHIAPLMLESQHIDSGMSGAAVLDMSRNLVVGVITQKWNPGESARDEYTGFAVDSAVVHLLSPDVRLHTDSHLPLSFAPPPNEQARERAAANVLTFPLPPAYHPSQPPTLDEWVGREALLAHLDEDYRNPAVHVTSLIGFGGEGKSSLAYRWVTHIPASETPDALFWWNFYDNRSFEAMIEEAAAYFYGEVAQTWRSTSGRVEAIGALMREKRLLLVLDGFEVMQETEGDRYGNIENRDVLRLLELCAQGEHTSFCLVTSRAPLLDLLNDKAHVQREVTRLELADGVQLLRNVGLTGTEAALGRIVTDWDGHALTVSLIGAYLRDTAGGDAGKYSKDIFPEIDQPAEGEARYKGVGRILRRYDAHLDEADRAFLKLFSVFRLPVPESAFERIFRGKTAPMEPVEEPPVQKPKGLFGRLKKAVGIENDDRPEERLTKSVKAETTGRVFALNAPLVGLDDTTFAALVKRLEDRRLIRHGAGQYTTHPLVRNHYLRLLEHESQTAQTAAHQAAAEHYQETSERPGRFPTLDDLRPYIEVVYHLCRAGAYDEAWDVLWNRILQRDRKVLIHQLGAYETYLNLLLEFFPDCDPAGEPQVSNPAVKSFILNEVGFCLMSLGRLVASAPFYERGNAMDADLGDHDNASIGYNNLTDVYLSTGQLTQAADAAAQALAQARQVEDEQERKQYERYSLAYAAWVAHQRGEMDRAGELFRQAEALEHEIDPDKQYLYSIRGVRHAGHLRRAGQADYARQVTDANLTICERNGWQDDISRCHRVLGDLDTDANDHETARVHYERALVLARGIDRRDVLIEALIAYGRWLAQHGGEASAGRNLLDEALGYCTESGYVLYEADARVALAQVALAEGDRAVASSQAAQALAIGARTGYHWAKVDAQDVLDRLGQQSTP